MSVALNREQGFSLPEVLLSVVLMMMVVMALSGLQSHLATGAAQLIQYRQLWREAWRQSQLHSGSAAAGWQLNRVQTSRQRCVSITVTITTPSGREGQLSRLHCPQN
ncbi:prepilin-type N-terminal cleavage/methylation domain-containing protein [Scandinavium lactucae]|uniref:Prepilin-type N-terminal cleavage/methylation domain-containing protein n=1 Tax=Scandinavium lactucae TaxID=3095028 RepID=A0ABU4QRF8_9ENTR|nr:MULTISPECIES: prepilin-type N-terminal cleavage/methylation domain-containing protein [unclassified Scandinavium]MDX6039870.1 prepilin-type N-terminal cleavage/methylation domain-containing protein [Scandinavium sp. V105_6]MDX6051397.1 prepilin-type N-terminal cleavage/methylation domain-containing protein [Scandinavium sp. V105_1]